MTNPARLACGSAALLLLCSCDAAVVAPATSQTENFVVNADPPMVPQTTARRDSEQQRVPRSPIEEPSMPQPDPKTSPPPGAPATPPAPPPRRVIVPAPTQPPAEIDPVQPYPGDEVPR